MTAPWWTWVPLGFVATAWACVMLRRGLRRVLRRRSARPAPGITDGIEAHIAVGSLSGVAPSDIKAHVLLVVTRDGELAVSGTAGCAGCNSLLAFALASAPAILARQAFAAHDHGHGGEQ